VKITREIINEKLCNFSIPNGECGEKAFKIAGILLNQEIMPFPNTSFNSFEDMQAEVANSLKNEKIVIIWLETGPKDASNPSYRAMHCYFIFQADPLLSFTIWDNAGVDFLDEKHIIHKIKETMGYFHEITLHVVPA